MARLDHCIDIHNCPPELVSRIMEERQKYLDDGYNATQAKIKAVEDILAQVDQSIEKIFSDVGIEAPGSLLSRENEAVNLEVNNRDGVLTELYKSLKDNLGRLQSKGILRIVDTIEEADGEPVYSKDGVPVAYYEDGTITLIASNIQPGEAKDVFMHEGLHYAMASDPIMSTLYKDIIWEFSQLVGKSAQVDAAYRKVPEDTDPRNVDEEALAYFLQDPRNRRTNIFRKVVANIKAFLKRLGFDVALTSEADFVAMAEQSMASAFRAGQDKKVAPRMYSKSTVRGHQQSEANKPQPEAAPDQYKDVKRSLAMTPKHIASVRSGKKTATTRSFPLKEGMYRLPDDTIIRVKKNTKAIPFSALKDPDAYAQAEGYSSIEDMKKNSGFPKVVDWIEGRGTMHVATFELVHAPKIEPYVPIYKRLAQQRRENPDAHIMHSGGAEGSDFFWGDYGAEHGIIANHYYWNEHDRKKPPEGNMPISTEELERYDDLLYQANDTLKRKFPPRDPEVAALLRRNAYQVMNGKVVLAIGQMTPNRKQVEGGTGWAVQMGIDLQKPVFVFDQNENAWFMWDSAMDKFVPGEPAVLPTDFAGVGTRKITWKGKNAIQKLFRKVFDPWKLSESQKRAVANAYFRGGPFEREEDRLRFVMANSREEVLRELAEYKERNGLTEQTTLHDEDYFVTDYMERFFPDDSEDVISGMTRARGAVTQRLDQVSEDGSAEISSAPTMDEIKWGWIKPLRELAYEKMEENKDLTFAQAMNDLIKQNEDTMRKLYEALFRNEHLNTYDPRQVSIDHMREAQELLKITDDMTVRQRMEVKKLRKEYKKALKAQRPRMESTYEGALNGNLTTLADYIIYSLQPFMQTHSIPQILSAVRKEEGHQYGWRAYPEALTDVTMHLQSIQEEATAPIESDWLTQDAEHMLDILKNGDFGNLGQTLENTPIEVYNFWNELDIPRKVFLNMRENGLTFELALMDVTNNEQNTYMLQKQFQMSEASAIEALQLMAEVFWVEGLRGMQRHYRDQGKSVPLDFEEAFEAGDRSAVPWTDTGVKYVIGDERKKQKGIYQARQLKLLQQEWANLKRKNYTATAAEIRGVIGAVVGMAAGQEESKATFTLEKLYNQILADEKVSEEFKNRLREDFAVSDTNRFPILMNILEALRFVDDWWIIQDSGMPLQEAMDEMRISQVDEQQPFTLKDAEATIRRMNSAVYVRPDNKSGQSTTISYEYGDQARRVLEMASERNLVETMARNNWPDYTDQQIAEVVADVEAKFKIGYSEFLMNEARQELRRLNNISAAELNTMPKIMQAVHKLEKDYWTNRLANIERFISTHGTLRLYERKAGYGTKKKFKNVQERQDFAKSKLNFDLMDLKALIAADRLATDMIVDAQFFEQMAEQHPEYDMTAIELFDVYRQAGKNEVRFRQKLEQARLDKAVTKAHAAYEGVVNGRDLPLAEKDRLAKEVAADRSLSPYEPNTPQDEYFNELVYNEIRNNWGISVPEQTSERWGNVHPEDLFVPVMRTEEGIQTGTLRREEDRQFYSDFAQSLGAEVIFVADHETKSQFVPSFYDEALGLGSVNDQIVINVNQSPNVGKILAQEALFRVMRSTDLKHRNRIIKALREISEPIKRHAYDMMGDGPLKSVMNSRLVDTNQNAFDLFYQDARKKNPGLSESEIQAMVAADIFSYYAANTAFHKALVEAINENTTKDALAEVYGNLVENLNKLNSIQNQDRVSMTYANRKLVTSPDIDGIYELIADIIGGTELKQKVMSSDSGGTQRLYSKMGGAAAAEIRTYAQKPVKPVKGFWKKLFAPGSGGYRRFMTNIETMLTQLFDWIKEAKSKKAFADYRANPTSMTLASMVNHGMEQAAYHLQVQLEPYMDTYRGMTPEAKLRLHDRIVRGLFINRDGEKEKREALDFTNPEHVAQAKKEGIPDDVIEVFKIYKEESDKIYKELKKYYKDLPYRATHYGQSLKWAKLNGQDMDTELMQLLYPERSEAMGRGQFLEEKNTEYTTEEIGARLRSAPIQSDPNQIILAYIRDATRMVKVHEMIRAGVKQGYVRYFENGKKVEQGFEPVDDPAFEVVAERMLQYRAIIDGVVQKDKDGNEVLYQTEDDAILGAKAKEGQTVTTEEVRSKSRVFSGIMVYRSAEGRSRPVGQFLNQEEADKFIAEQNDEGEYTSIPTYRDATGRTVIGRYHFEKELAQMLRTIFAKDHFREFEFGALTGKRLLRFKNAMTAIEFAFSMFHAMTISQEHMAWSLGLKMQKNKGIMNKAKALRNPFSIFKEGLTDARDIRAMFDAYHKDPTIAKDPAFVNKFREVTGSDNMDVVDAIHKFFMVGGLPHQDPLLRADAHYFGKIQYMSGTPEFVIENGEAKIISPSAAKGKLGVIPDVVKNVMGSIKDTHERLVEQYPDRPVANMFKTMQFTGLEATTAWLMEKGIPKIKMGMWFKVYAHKLQKSMEKGEFEKLTAEQAEVKKMAIAHDTMKFVEDCFGEVNWRNQWMVPTYKSALIFMFRSFTWFTGSWKAISKTGADMAKWGWFKIKDFNLPADQRTNYELTEKGYWGINAVISHLMVAAAVRVAYEATVLGMGGEEAEDDEDVDILSRMLFPRFSPEDPYDRITIPSYVTEGYKIFHHLGLLGHTFEPFKLISGRFNSFIGNAMEIVEGQDFRGVEVRNSHDPLPKQALDSALHFFAVAPIAVSALMDDVRREGWRNEKMIAFMGVTDAPAVAKRSRATSYAYDLTRKKFSSMVTSDEDASRRDEVSRAAFQYSQGNKKPLQDLLSDGKIGWETYQRALEKVQTIEGKPNPLYQKPLRSAMDRLSIEEAMDTWEYMTDAERAEMRPVMVEKFFNVEDRDSRGLENLREIGERMRELGILL